MNRIAYLLLALLCLVSEMARAKPKPDASPELDDSGSPWTEGCPRSCKCKWISGKRTADCESQQLQELPHFEQPEQIQVLHLSYNPIGELPPRAFHNRSLINLQKIYLHSCNLTAIHATAFYHLLILIEIDLTGNQVRTLAPGTFEGNQRIRKLWLSHNPLRTLHGYAFPSIPHLRTLDLSHGHLTKLGRSTFMHLEHLEVLHLHDNHFKRLDKRVFQPLRSLKSLTLERNPWQCDCRLQDFWQWIMLNNLFNHPTSCTLPGKLSGQAWDRLNASVLACPPEISVPESMVTVSTGATVRLSCLVTENPEAELKWVRSGVIIANNSRNVEDGGHQYFTIHMESATSTPAKASGGGNGGVSPSPFRPKKNIVSVIDGSEPVSHSGSPPGGAGKASGSRRVWFNLTIENVHPSGSGGYTCVARNEGGMAEGNITVVYSESVATYLENSDMPTLLFVVTSLAGGLVFMLLVFAVLCFVLSQAKRRRRRDERQQLMKVTSAKTNGMVAVLTETEPRGGVAAVNTKVNMESRMYEVDRAELEMMELNPSLPAGKEPASLGLDPQPTTAALFAHSKLPQLGEAPPTSLDSGSKNSSSEMEDSGRGSSLLNGHPMKLLSPSPYGLTSGSNSSSSANSSRIPDLLDPSAATGPVSSTASPSGCTTSSIDSMLGKCHTPSEYGPTAVVLAMPQVSSTAGLLGPRSVHSFARQQDYSSGYHHLQQQPQQAHDLVGVAPMSGGGQSLMDRMWKDTLGSQSPLLTGSNDSMTTSSKEWHPRGFRDDLTFRNAAAAAAADKYYPAHTSSHCTLPRKPAGGKGRPGGSRFFTLQQQQQQFPPPTTSQQAAILASQKPMVTTAPTGSFHGVVMFPSRPPPSLQPKKPLGALQQQQQQTDVLVQEIEQRKELLEALVKDKTDTVV